MMAPESGGSRQSERQQSVVCTNPLETKETMLAVSCLRKTIQSCIGPCGKQHVIHNGCGGHVTLTSSSGRLLRTVSMSNPVLQLLTAPVVSHNKKHSDGGLFSLLLSLTLIETSTKLAISKHLLVDVYEMLLDWCLEVLDSQDFSCRTRLDLDSAEQLVSVARSVIGTKSGCCLSSGCLDSICHLVVKSFLKAVSAEHGVCGDLLYLGIEGKDPGESRLLPGVLIEAPYICPLRKKVFHTQQNAVPSKRVKVALFTVSLAGDASPLPPVTLQVKQAGQVESTVRAMLLELGQGLVDAGVQLVVCQKVVHPSLKRLWGAVGVVVLERLGTRMAGAVQRLSGAIPITSTVAANLDSSCFGWISDLQHQVLEGKSYVQLIADHSPVHTLMVCNFAEEPLAELKSVCQAAVSVLERMLLQPWTLSGGGVWQAQLALRLHDQLQIKATSSSDKLGCTVQQFKDAAKNFLCCLAKVASSIDKGSGLLHKELLATDKLRYFENIFPCEFIQSSTEQSDICSESGLVLDSLCVCKDALVTAVSSAAMALSVGVIIRDVN